MDYHFHVMNFALKLIFYISRFNRMAEMQIKLYSKMKGYWDAPMTPRDHLMKRKLGVKGPLDVT